MPAKPTLYVVLSGWALNVESVPLRVWPRSTVLTVGGCQGRFRDSPLRLPDRELPGFIGGGGGAWRKNPRSVQGSRRANCITRGHPRNALGTLSASHPVVARFGNASLAQPNAGAVSRGGGRHSRLFRPRQPGFPGGRRLRPAQRSRAAGGCQRCRDRRRVLLMHGDSLCTDDHDYQQFRAMVRVLRRRMPGASWPALASTSSTTAGEMDALAPRPGRSVRPSGARRSKRCDHLLTVVARQPHRPRQCSTPIFIPLPIETGHPLLCQLLEQPRQHAKQMPALPRGQEKQ